VRWLLVMKSEPDAYSWEKAVAEGGPLGWLRNAMAARNLKTMKSGIGLLLSFEYRQRIVRIMEIAREHYPITPIYGRWVMSTSNRSSCPEPVTLAPPGRAQTRNMRWCAMGAVRATGHGGGMEARLPKWVALRPDANSLPAG